MAYNFTNWVFKFSMSNRRTTGAYARWSRSLDFKVCSRFSIIRVPFSCYISMCFSSHTDEELSKILSSFTLKIIDLEFILKYPISN